ncbi:HET-domain-containing protein [Hyaloscypha variabilis F]|uniref:HET-domain-containing protein n=1 Tax=Hyaloscypha variabilis (strain UAMH 11265 / GT02V1 / F) TaxID=1149755 RepID=A0A2J6R142_HYAVF|nr:HET-domain-containing protein [Hyaloscypha variabilis F]PMD34518.1 HET-domain-containing protein [Hyaloscypha variabilis F]
MASTIDALPIARRWYQECRTLHKTCKRSPKSAIPTRLIDISGNEPCLRLADELGSEVEYATLSHCWGSLKFTRLTKSTFESFRKRIPPEALTKTFKNAIFIAQYFGFRFLWIDSLFILQDSMEDWSKESTLMSEVYGECDLNIAATSAKDGSEGCFFPRERSWRCQVSPTSQTEQIYDCYPYSTLEPYVDRLSKRAWVLQERCLSQRTVHFANNQLYWECCGIVASEIYPNGYPLSIARDKFLYQKRQLSRSSWPKLVEMYSGGLTTMSSDRLVAIGGLARVIYSKSQDEYIAGFWKKGLEGQLLWQSHGLNRRIDPYSAPTWSWASLQGGVSFHDWHKNENALSRMCTFRVHDIQMQYVSDNPFGQVRTGILRLRCSHLASGVIQRGPLFVSIGNYDFNIGRHIAHDFHISFDCIEEEERGGEDEEETWFIHVHVLPIWTDNSAGLLLRPTGRKRGHYERIGAYHTSELSTPAIEDANLVALEWDHHFAEVSSDSNGNKEYFIDLV